MRKQFKLKVSLLFVICVKKKGLFSMIVLDLNSSTNRVAKSAGKSSNLAIKSYRKTIIFDLQRELQLEFERVIKR